jgi:murein L,D-transpeptidase YafK
LACARFATCCADELSSATSAEGRRHGVQGGLDHVVVGLGGNPIGPKQFEGDQKTPEGAYLIDRQNPNSNYHLSIGISYPNQRDVEFAESQGKNPGGDIFIHGRARKNKGRGKDWTAGCIAVKDGEMEEIYSMVRVGTPIYIYP